MARRPDVSVIVPVYRDVARLRLLLADLAAQDLPAARFEVLVVDNGGNDGIESILPQGNARLLHEATPGSYAARNHAIAVAAAPILAFTDADCRPSPAWLREGLAALGAHPEAGFLAGRIKLFARDAAAPTASELYEIGFAFDQERNVAVKGYGLTANLFVPRAVMDRVGPFDARVRGSADRDWGQRCNALGLRGAYAPAALVRHPARRTPRQLSERVRRTIGAHMDVRRLRRQGATDLPTVGSMPLPRFLWTGAVLNPGAKFLILLREGRLTPGRAVRFLGLWAYLAGVHVVEPLRIWAGGRSTR